LNRGEIRWYALRSPDKRRPVLILTRNEVIDHLNEIIVAPITRTIRGLATEVVLMTACLLCVPSILTTSPSPNAGGLDQRFVLYRSRNGHKCVPHFSSLAVSDTKLWNNRRALNDESFVCNRCNQRG
jgi:hypothetical protein